jgi:tRNA (adenine37-N6)-methyltransferase
MGNQERSVPFAGPIAIVPRLSFLRKANRMSKAIRYSITCTAAMFVGGLAFPLIAQAGEGKTTDGGKAEAAEAAAKPITLHPIGTSHSPYKQEKGTPIQGVFDNNAEAWVELADKYAKGLKDLEGFSHAILLYSFHLSDKEEIVGKPYLEDQEHGIFAMRSPHRPNHIGLSVVKIKRIEGNRLYFAEVDVLDGTPVLDIKPYVKQFDCREDAVSGWIEKHFQGGKQPENTTAR